MSKCSSCKKDFIPSLKKNGLPFQTCDRCRSDDKKYKDTHKEYTKEYGIYYRELNRDMLKEKAKEYFEKNKDKICSAPSRRMRTSVPRLMSHIPVCSNVWSRATRHSLEEWMGSDAMDAVLSRPTEVAVSWRSKSEPDD